MVRTCSPSLPASEEKVRSNPNQPKQRSSKVCNRVRFINRSFNSFGQIDAHVNLNIIEFECREPPTTMSDTLLHIPSQNQGRRARDWALAEGREQE